MADYLTPASELDAVNLMLSSFGGTRINSLAGELPIDAAEAQGTLNEISRDIQKRGWYWNTEYYKLSPNTDGKIALPENTLSVDAVDSNEGLRVTARSGFLYNLTPYSSGDDFTDYDPISLKLVLGLKFDDLPGAARAYVSHKAARIFVARQEGDQIALQTAGQEENTSLADLRREDNRAVPRSMRNSLSVRRVLARGVDYLHNDYGSRTFLRRSGG